MSLEDLNKELHSRVDEEKSKEPVASPAALPTLPELEKVETVAEVPLGEAWGGDEKREVPITTDTPAVQHSLFKIPKKLALGLGIVALASLAAGVFFKAGGWLFAPENVQIAVSGPKETDSNKIVEYTISIENNNWVDLENAELIITYPTIFRFVAENGFEANASRATLQIGMIKKSSLSSIKIRGSFQSLQDQVALITATLRAAPSGVTSKVDFPETRYSVAVEGSSLIIDLAAPLQAGDGQYADYVVTYRNESSIAMDNLELRLSYPEGFTPKDLTPRPNRDENIWTVSRLAPGESGIVTVRGIINGAQGDVKRIAAELGVPQGDGSLFSYADIVRQTRIIASPLVITQRITGDRKAMAPGESVSYRIIFRNDGDVGLRDLIITVDLDPKYFDISRIDLAGGTYNVQKKQAIFRASDRPVLSLIEPGQGGEIGFAVPIRNDLALYNQSNIEIESIAKIDSPDVPTPIGANKIIASNRITFKVMTAVVFEMNGYHFDGFGNTGPVPPVVGKETEYTIKLRAISTINALENALVSLSVPGQVRYIKTQAVTQGAVTYNDRTGEIFWNIGTIPPGTARPTELSIQIGLTPDPSQVGESAPLVNPVEFSATDIWSGEFIERKLPFKTTSLQEDRELQAIPYNDKVRSNE